MAFGLRMRRIAKDKTEDLTDRYIGLTGLRGFESNRPYELSGGMKQRACLARALVNNPSVILADEPTGNLDSYSSVEIMGIFQDLNEKGISIVLITHEPEIAMYTQRVIRVSDGLIVSDEQVENQLAANEEIKSIKKPGTEDE